MSETIKPDYAGMFGELEAALDQGTTSAGLVAIVTRHAERVAAARGQTVGYQLALALAEQILLRIECARERDE
jgi:hypothetical protein